jgi:branched-chain amino acid transport system substrate-binding protein
MVLPIASCGGTTTTGNSIGQVNVGEIFPLSGRFAGAGQRFIKGAQLAVADINAHGGIGGKNVNEYPGDDASDSVDAVPAMRQLLLHNLTFIAGPISPTFDAIHPIVDQNSIVAMSTIPSSQYDSLNDKWVFRTVVSDTVLATAMAYYAIKQGYTKCSMLFENIQSAQGLVQPIIDSYTKNGGTILDNVQLTPHAASYRSEIQKAFQQNPQCIFAQTDPTTTGTLFANARELGHLNVPFVGTDSYTDINIAKAAGLSEFTKVATGMLGAPPAGAAWSYFETAYKAKFSGEEPGAFSAAVYDGVVIAALAIQIAGSSDPKVFVNSITAVTNDETAKECNNYTECLALVKAGQKIDYEGASGPMDFDVHHSVYSGINVYKFDAAGNLQSVFTCPPDALAAFIAK